MIGAKAAPNAAHAEQLLPAGWRAPPLALTAIRQARPHGHRTVHRHPRQAIQHGRSNARITQINTHIRLITRRTVVFHSLAPLIALAKLSSPACDHHCHNDCPRRR